MSACAVCVCAAPCFAQATQQTDRQTHTQEGRRGSVSAAAVAAVLSGCWALFHSCPHFGRTGSLSGLALVWCVELWKRQPTACVLSLCVERLSVNSVV